METGAVLHEESFSYEGPLALCDRSAQGQAKQGARTAAGVGAAEQTNANQIGSNLIPGLEREAQNPVGYSPTDLNSQLVASQSGAGGANAGVMGEAKLAGARTRNAGGYTAALDEASRNKGRQESQGSLNIASNNAGLKQKQQQFAQGQLSGLYGTDTNAMLKAMGLVPEDVNAEANAGKSGWLQDFTGIMSALGGAAQGAGSIMNGMKQ
jgi:hypothetical protein